MAVDRDETMADAEKADDEKQVRKDPPKKPAAKKKKKGEEEVTELSEEDQELKANLEMMVERIKDSDPGVQSTALDNITREIRSATTSMTSVPKPLKFLRPQYEGLKSSYDSLADGENKRKLADVISVLAITTGKEGERESLKYRLLGTTVCLTLDCLLKLLSTLLQATPSLCSN